MNTGGKNGYWYSDSAAARLLLRCARGVAVLSSLFLAGVAVLVIAGWMQVRSSDPLKDTRLVQLREELKIQPDREELKAEIRALDLLARRVYLSNVDHVNRGVRLLATGLIILVLAGGMAVELSRKLPAAVDADREGEWRSFGSAWRVLVAASMILGVAGLASGIRMSRDLKADAAGPDQDLISAVIPEGDIAAMPGEDVLRRNWPGFRGPSGSGICYAKNIPLAWDIDSGSNILWRTPLQAGGYSCPVIWGRKVFVTRADASLREMICLDLDTGKMLWQGNVGPYPGGPAEYPEVFDANMHAAPTPVTDGERVYGMFANGDLACFDFNGKEIWGRNTGLPDITYGYASSPVLCNGKLIIQLEGENRYTIAALNRMTGERIWEAERDDISWSTPVCFKSAEGSWNLITTSVSSMSAFSDKGDKLWTIADCISGEVGASATVFDGIVIISSMGEGVRAYRPAADSDPVWIWDEDPAEMASPLYTGGRIYIASGGGYVAALSADDGAELWQVQAGSEYYASPVYAGGRVYVIDREGKAVVFEEGPVMKILAENMTGKGTDSTPAFVEGRIVIRTGTGLVCIGKPGVD